MHPIGMVRVRHFKFVCRTMHIEPIVPRFRDVPTETLQTPTDENWYQDLKDVPFIALPEKALVGASMSLNWRMNRERSRCIWKATKKMATIVQKPDEELWYHRIVRNFVLPRDDDLVAQPAAGAGEHSNLGIGPGKKRRVPTTTSVPKNSDAEKTQLSKAKNVRGVKKGMRCSSNSRCDYVSVSVSLEGLAPAVIMRRPKPEPKGAADIPPSNPDDPIDLESSPERLLRKKVGKRKQTDAEAEGQPAKKVQKKKITRRGNLDAFTANPLLKKSNSHVHTEPSFVVNEELPPSPPRTSVNEKLKNTEALENETEKTSGAENLEVKKSADGVVDAKKVTSSEVVDIGAGPPQTPEFVTQDSEKGKFAQEIPVTTSPSMASGFMLENIEKVPAVDQGSFSDADKNSPIRPDETLGDYY
ncbi:hypothetical protein Hanom_Chr04g00339041 [Helianthus anomalus]